MQSVALQADALAQSGAELTESQVVAIKEREIRESYCSLRRLIASMSQDQVVQRRLIRNMRFMDPERAADDQTLLTEAFIASSSGR